MDSVHRFGQFVSKDGADASALASSLVQRSTFYEIFLPQHFAGTTRPFKMGFAMYNSDLIVYSQALINTLTLNHSMAIVREVMWWGKLDTTSRSQLIRIATYSRMLWIYLALFKLLKLYVVRLRWFRQAKQMTFRTFSFIIYLIGCIFTLDQFLDVYFSDRIDVTNDVPVVSNVRVKVFDGFYVHRLPGVIIHTLITVVLLILLLFLYRRWFKDHDRRNNTTMFDTFAIAQATVVWDPQLCELNENQVVTMPIGTVCNIKWFLMYHFFGSTIITREEFAKFRERNTPSNTSKVVNDDHSLVTVVPASSPNENIEDSSTTATLICGQSRDGEFQVRIRSSSQNEVVMEHSIAFYNWVQTNRKIILK